MTWSSLTGFLVPAARTVAGFTAAFLLAFTGDITARLFNLSIGYPWDPAVHHSILFVSIGLGASIGSYLAWVNVHHSWRMMLIFGLIVLVAGIAGSYLGRFYGPGPDPTYWWSRYATDRTVYLAAAGLGTGVATLLGLADLIYAKTRPRARVTPMSPNV